MKTIIVLVLLTLTGIIPGFAAGELPLVTDEWPPYTSKNMEGQGFYTEIVSAVIAEMGMSPKHIFVPWKRGEQMIKSGEIFAIFPYICTPERQKDFDFSENVLDNKQQFVFFYNKRYMKEVPTWSKLEDLKPYSLGGTLGAGYIADFEKAGLKAHYAYSDETNIKMLRENRVALILTEETAGRYMIRKLYPDESDLFGVLEKPFRIGNHLRLMISRTYPGARDLTERFNQALKGIKEKGIYKEILIRHGIPAN